ncbi:hypothetical protein LZ31DRAFT_286788 [Colletotrichum somersetense]|nr:hypothetical protein LZ31DRAFT_286788 [Colletotrichum somersetense]
MCDYADGHKCNESWRDFAAAMAASTTRAFLEIYEQAEELMTEAFLENKEQAKKPTPTRTQHPTPLKENPYFVGRSDILERIKQVFRDRHNEPRQLATGRSLRIVLYGPVGIGKTEIALAYVSWLLDVHPKVSLFWVDASTAERFRKAYHSIAKKHNIPGWDDPEADILSLVKTWLEREYRVQRVMVIGGVERTESFFSQPGKSIADAHQVTQADLRFYIPEYRHGTILFTTRNEQVGLDLAQGGPVLEVGKMSESEAQQLFRKIVRPETPGNIAALCVRLEHEPLATDRSAWYIRANKMSIGKYLDHFGSSYADRQGDDGVSAPGLRFPLTRPRARSYRQPYRVRMIQRIRMRNRL